MHGDHDKSCSSEEIARICGIKISRPQEFLNSLVCTHLLELTSNNRYKLTSVTRNLCCNIAGEENYGVKSYFTLVGGLMEKYINLAGILRDPESF